MRVLAVPRDGGLHLLALAALLLAFIFLLGGQAQAADLQASDLKVSVWPEYDDPRVLVIMQADLDPSTPLPAKVSFNVPKGAEIGMACEIQPDGGHACKPFQTADNGDFLTITFQVESQRKVFLEYYHQSFTAGTAERAFDFVYKPAFAAKTMQLEVQQPARSTAFTLDPAFGQTAQDSQGLVYHFKDYTDVAAGQDVVVKVAYSKSDDQTSVKPKEQQATGGSPAASAGSSGGGNSLLLVVGALGFAALLFGGYKIFRPAAATSARSTTARSKRKLVANRRGSAARSARKFCTSCGQPLAGQDLYCSGCGEPQV